MQPTTQYEEDLAAWAHEQARLLRAGCFEQLDTEHLSEELESMSASERRELVNRLVVLLAHLLKWQQQPQRRTRSWKLTIQEQRMAVEEVLSDSPSLRARADALHADAYRRARLRAARETDLDESVFPANCPWALAQVLDAGFYPDRSV